MNSQHRNGIVIAYPSSTFHKRCREAIAMGSPFCIRVSSSCRKANAIRRTAKSLMGSGEHHPFITDLIDRIRLLTFWLAVSPAIAEQWQLTYEDGHELKICFAKDEG